MEQRGRVRERVIRVLLNEPTGTLTMYRISKEAKCSFAWVHEFLRKLEGKRLANKTKVKEYRGLVEYWLEVKTKAEKKEYMHKDPLSLLKQTKLQYALTTYQAETLVQHYLFPSRIDLYIKAEDTEQWHQLITAEGLVGKGNVRLLITDDHVFYGSFKKDRLNVVCLPQLVVDLFEEGGVCVEAAERLLEKVALDIVRTS